MSDLKVLTNAAITELTGEAEHERLVAIEVIFGHYEHVDVHALRQCWNLRNLTMINTKLTRIANLHPVRDSLLHLCLANQAITTMEGLDLPNLRQLYLQQNRIDRIEGLSSCRKLQKLWLYGNRISLVENLSCCSDLRELWLQDNQIRSLDSNGSGLDDLVNLHALHLAKNRIRNIDEFQHFRKLVNLRVLTFSDEHFGSNPIVNHPDYRSFAVAALRQLVKLDGRAIESAERTLAEDQFFTQALQSLEFNDKIADLTLAYEEELRAINGRKDRGISNAKMLQKGLMEALNELEQCVMEGRKRVESERQRQTKLLDRNAVMLVENVKKLQERFERLIDRRLEEEENMQRAEDILFEAREQELQAEQSQALTVAALQYAFPGRIAFQQLVPHSPEFRLISSHLTNDSSSKSNASAISILQIYRFFHQDLMAQFEAAVTEANASNGLMTANSSELLLYVAANDDEAMTIMQSGVGALCGNASIKAVHDPRSWLVFCSSARDAVDMRASESQALFTAQATEGTKRVQCLQVLLCRVRMNRVVELVGNNKEQIQSLKDAVYTCATSVDEPSPETFYQLRLASGSSMYLITKSPTACWQLMLPQFTVLCGIRVDGEDCAFQQQHCPRMDDVVHAPEDNAWVTTTQVLQQFQEQLEDEVAAFHTRLYQDMDPETAVLITSLQQEASNTQEQVHATHTKLTHERKAQDQLLKAMRNAGGRHEEGR
ncbi:TPA: hypothetical protein N0F65_011836 [Lagenidium giganteum]|uniref:Uncharacterized protein n=1 Tax=Lagenidium giganteum TaxID=4803 RepID=A0AAV2Z2X2_9STRA|nr:TPA: hypothetical protein N0F65_011836 [Lagenidium giganteum]